jgi:DNA-binding Xre family transcriptional regulator
MIRRKKRGNLKPNKSSILLDLKPTLLSRNILHPSAYLIKIGINSNTANKMLKGKAVQVSFRQLTTLCLHLNCTPNDLMVLRQMDLPETHALNALKVLSETTPTTVTEWLKGKTLAEIEAMMKE